MATNEIVLKLNIDGKEANAALKLTDENLKSLYKGFKYGKQGVDELTTGISRGFNNAREIIIGFKEAYGVISQVFATHLQAYREQEDAIVKLTTALRQSNQLTEANIQSLTDYAAKLQETTVYGDEVTETVMAQLVAMGLNVDQTKRATLQAANLATVMGVDLTTAAKAMADLFTGNIGRMGRYIKGLDESIVKSKDLDKIMAMLNERIGGQAVAMGNTATGQIAKMNNAIGDLKENAGKLLADALGPMIKAIADIVGGLNKLSPELTGIIGILGSITTAFITLRVTGIIPAIKSVELFGIALTGLKATLVKTGIGALIVALGYGLNELAKAYSNFEDAKRTAADSYDNFLNEIRSESIKAGGKELEWMIKNAEENRDRLKSNIEKLKDDINNAKEKVVTKDKEDNEYINYYDTEASKQLEKQLKNTEYQLKLENDKIKIYEEQKNKKTDVIKLSDDELKKQFDKNRTELSEAQRHQQAMLQIEKGNDLLILQMKITHFSQIIALYKKYGQDTVALVNQKIEAEKDLELKLKDLPQIETEDFIDDLQELEDVQYGNLLRYARLSKQQEIDLWYETEREKISAYENSTEMLSALDEERNRRQRELQDEQLQDTADALGQISGVFAKHTVAYQAFAKAQALIDTYTSAEAAYKAVVGIPVVGPALAIAAAAAAIIAGLARVEQIGKVNIPKGYAEGGRLPQGRAGYVEGWHNELIAPEKTFVEIFKQELRPQILNNGSANGFDVIGIKESINRLNNALEQGIIARAYLDDREARKITSTGNYLNNKTRL